MAVLGLFHLGCYLFLLWLVGFCLFTQSCISMEVDPKLKVSVPVTLVHLNRDVKPINTVELKWVAIQASILCSTDWESSCFTILKVMKDLLRFLRVIVCRNICGKKFDPSSIECLVTTGLHTKDLRQFGKISSAAGSLCHD